MFFPKMGSFARRVPLVPEVVGKSSGASAKDAILYAHSAMSI